MSQSISPSQLQPAGAAHTFQGVNPIEDLGTGDFLDLLVAELQNQDPLEPTDNSQFLQQIGQIRQLTSSDQLVTTLKSVQQGQDVSTASQLIGKTVKALDEDNNEISGVVDRATVATDPKTDVRVLKVHIGDKEFNLDRIREIVS